MAGCRSLTDNEVTRVLNQLPTSRDRLLFVLGLKTGFRISEILTLKVKDVWTQGSPAPQIKVQRRNTKTKQSRQVPMHPHVAAQLLEYLAQIPDLDPESPLFMTRLNKGLSRHGAHKILKLAYVAAGIGGAVATHSMRKTFAEKVYKALDKDLVATQAALGHSSIMNTIKYLEPSKDRVEAAILAV